MTNFICALEPWLTVLAIIIPILVAASIIFIACGVTRKPPENKKSTVEKSREPAKHVASDSPRAASVAIEPVAMENSINDLSEPEPTPESAFETTSEVEEYVEEEEPAVEVKQPKFVVRYNKSFTAKLILASDEIKEYYAQLASKLISYKKVKCRTSWALASFNVGREKLAKITVKGKSLYLYVALDPKDYIDTKYRAKDASDKKRFEATPTVLKIKSERSKTRALEIIDVLAAQKLLTPADKPQSVKASDYPADTLENLLARKLVKENKRKESAPKKTVIKKVLKTVTVTQAQKLVTDEAAATLLTTDGNSPAATGKKFPVNIDVLSTNFDNGATVDIAALKAKRIVPQSATAIKILARGSLEHKLTVYADDYSADAVKMIALTGGKAIKGRRR